MKANSNKEVVVAISGGFDPMHIGHVRMIQEAAQLGDKLVVILNNDNWLRAKKGYVFMPQQERKELLEAVRGVDKVVLTKHPRNLTDNSVCEELRKIKPDIFANGGDRGNTNTPESLLCKKMGIKLVFEVGRGGKVQSSSWLVGKAMAKGKKKL